MFANYLIGLREGLEASLIISILVAYLVKTGRRDRLVPVAYGVLAALAISVAFGALLTFTSSNILSTFESREIFGGTLSIIAVGFVTWMVFWMRRTSRNLKAHLSGRLDAAIAVGAAAVTLTAFAAVAREGLETALFFWSAVQAAGTTTSPVAGFTLGITTSIVLAWLLYRRSVTLNLSTFFTWTGAGLVLVAGGVLAYGIHDLQEGGVIPGLNTLAFDISAQIPPSSWYATLLKGTLNFSPATTVAQAAAWLLYVIPVMTLFLYGNRTPAKPVSAAAGAGSSASSVAGATKTGAVASAAALVALLVLGGCGSDSASSEAASIKVTAGDKTCETTTATLEAGNHVMAVSNTGSQITEVYVYGAGDRIVGEVENVGPSTTRDLTVQLAAGDYQVACKPGMTGSGIRQPLKVTGTAGAAVPVSKQLQSAVDGYRSYVISQSETLLVASRPFVAAVRAGNIAEAKRLYPRARIYYERIEPIAESLPKLDPAIDARRDGVESVKEWTGFHRLEYDLWKVGDISKSGPVADQLLVDEKQLIAEVKTVKITPDQLGNGARALLDEVATSKVTGEEERYSHIDLVDFKGNLEGAKTAYAELRPVLADRDAALAATLDTRFEALDAELDKFAKGHSYVLYTDLSRADVRGLAARVDAVAEPLSRVTAVVLKQ